MTPFNFEDFSLWPFQSNRTILTILNFAVPQL